MRGLSHRWAPEAVLLFATSIWGLAFLIVHEAMAQVPPLPFIAIRFATAALMVSVLTRPRLGRVTLTELRAGAAIGTAMLCGYGLQATGLQTLGAGRAAFIGALYVPLVPLLQWLAHGIRPSPLVCSSAVLATAGMMVLTGAANMLPHGAGLKFGHGEAFALSATLAVATEIVLIAQFAPRVDPRRLAVLECCAVSGLAVTLAPEFGQQFPPLHPFWLSCALFLGAASAFLQVSSNWAMRKLSGHRAVLIYATEPVWAALFGAAAGERIGASAVVGASLIMCALLLNAVTQMLNRSGSRNSA